MPKRKEGDNLEVLKLFQKPYHGKIKMIYIDPPYNTGKDFVYMDNYRDNMKNYLEFTEQVDEEGHKLSTNTDTSGRYHTDWLNMMYPRLRLARNLLTDDGVIFISIDDNEVHNLRKICDEVFGEDNFINIISVKMKNNAGASGGGEDKKLKKNLEYILLYAKNYQNIKPFNSVYAYQEISELLYEYKENNISWKYTSVLYYEGDKRYLTSTADGDGNEIKIFERLNPIYKSVNQIMNEKNKTEKEVYYDYFDRIFTTAMPQSSIRVRVVDAIDETDSNEDLYSIEYIPKSGKNKGVVYEQFYKGNKKRLITWFKDVGEIINGDTYKKDIKGTYWDGYNLNNLTKEGNIKFENGKKPLALIKDIIKMITLDNDIILDFFSGSSTTAHAVMDLNAEDGGNRKFITVQLPEPTDEKSEAYKEGYKTIADIGRERIRRAGEKILEDNKDKEGIEDLDIGFKSFKLDSSNIKEWNPEYMEKDFTMEELVNNFVPNRSEEDILYEIILKYGIDLAAPIEEHEVNGKIIYNIGFGALYICLDNNIDNDVVEEILKLNEEYKMPNPMVVFKDIGFKNDEIKLNAELSLNDNGIEEVVSI